MERQGAEGEKRRERGEPGAASRRPKILSRPRIALVVFLNSVLVLPSTLRVLIQTMDIYLYVHLGMESKDPASFLPT